MMKTKVNGFPDELKLKVLQEYLDTDVSQRELMQKFNIRTSQLRRSEILVEIGEQTHRGATTKFR